MRLRLYDCGIGMGHSRSRGCDHDSRITTVFAETQCKECAATLIDEDMGLRFWVSCDGSYEWR